MLTSVILSTRGESTIICTGLFPLDNGSMVVVPLKAKLKLKDG